MQNSPVAFRDFLLQQLDKTDKRVLYLMNERITISVAAYVKDYFMENENYDIELKPCPKNSSWDIIITKLK